MPPWYQLPPSPALGTDATVAIVGAGLAGSWLAFELSLRGLKPLLIDRGAGPGSGASGNPVGVVKPFVTRDAGRAEQFHTDACRHLLSRLNEHALTDAAQFQSIDVVQLLQKPWPARADLHTLSSADITHLTGLSAAAVGEASGLRFAGAGWLNPGALCRALVSASSTETRFGAAALIEHRPEDAGTHWRIKLDNRGTIDVDHLILANGPAIIDSPFTSHLPVTPARGQIDRFARGEASPLKRVVTGLHWALPDGDIVATGSTYQRDDLDTASRREDTDLNRAGLQDLLGQEVGQHIDSRAQIRATTPDRLPFVGPVCNAEKARSDWAELHRGRAPDTYATPHYVDGLSVLGGFGSRGIVTIPRSAYLLADWLCGAGSSLQEWAPELCSHRFIVRDGRKGRLQSAVNTSSSSAPG